MQPGVEIGRRAMSLLLRRLADPLVKPETLLARPRIFHGTSCGCDGSAPLSVEGATSTWPESDDAKHSDSDSS